MRSKSLITTLFASYFLCEHAMAMETYTQYFEHGKSPFTNVNINALREIVSTLEEREFEEAKHRDEEGNFLIDYSNMRVCDVQTSTASHYSQVFDEIRPLFAMVARSQPIVMNFAGNFLQDEGVGALADFILDNSLLKNNLRKLDLSNNRFRVGSLTKLKYLAEQCPHLETLNIAINSIGVSDVNQAFQELSTDKRKIVHFSPY